MSVPYSVGHTPPAPVLNIRIAAPGEKPPMDALSAIVDTGSDGTLIPLRYLEQVEATHLGQATLWGVLGESREVHLYEIDMHIESLVLPGVVVVGDDFGDEFLLGRNILNKLVILLDGLRRETEFFEQRPRRL